MKKISLRRKSIAALMLAFMAAVMLPGCSSTEEEAEECDSSLDNYEECVKDLPI